MKHTIPQREWMNYPVLEKKACEHVAYKFGELIHVDIFIGKQDGFFVTGYLFVVDGEVSPALRRELSPSRKWGEYPTRDRALLDTLHNIARALYAFSVKAFHNDIEYRRGLSLMNNTINAIKGFQLTIFK